MTTDTRPPGPAAPAPRALAAKTKVKTTAKARTAKAKFTGLAVVCAKCAKRQGLRPKAVRALLRDAFEGLRPPGQAGGGEGQGRGKSKSKSKGKAGRRKLCVVETGCLGPCPKRAVAVATGRSLAAGRVVLLDPAAGPEGARAVLLPEFGPNAGLAEAPNPEGAGTGPARSS